MRLFVIATILAAACAQEAPTTTDSAARRMPVAIEYVRADSLAIHAAPRDDAPVVARYDNGESVSVLSRKGDWSEVRTAAGSGWAHASELASAAEAKKSESDTLNVRFRTAPSPVTEPGAHGEILLVADVNSDGEVLDVKVERNTTGSRSLEARNIASLRRAKFVPIVRHGKRMPFTYDYHVSY
jgi:uncharacterized protein YgiM (DUF1202 family)